uniref:Myosin motor domain-containing protein n=1 Tax=Paramoeba aestuarina TaxID=180227 RepID=A0A7S4KA64_9EUKA|mmetsp:Transcript_16622/g.25866  ORF Transcript_16622/g.25866 Transcript_16622/m.25866 type:complete len:849 (+) Transcript_16622:78-2624(+)|eukprot:CAMPEP_0201519006 /NCGR_PEP_ID=MMETSP0161_2-20130828/9681_1 /ASSEMBLY_ACC=CAM_ASM_000251 /TAXON_ID=180227 /ORGANISM="Neoparamoeba aestuarina, Strain SoJaBio B1-5/56/2" /LENGTH=848 /DNA_ID=CAMNT_0047916927 /DNA_START=48 /DNA_END=2594 /DNA_ORIENTATION=+
MAALRGERDKVGRDDLITLQDVGEDGIINNLRQRYQASMIYTSIGAVLISINPYKDVGCFNHSNVSKYKGKQSFEMPPHVFQLGEETYKALITERLNQCIIISGESGAGKTECSKGLMTYFAAVTSSHSKAIDHVKDIILESNPLLESFGNAKTLRNNNSSRFGKYMEIQFDAAGSQPIGGKISNYLLEKSRLVQQTPGERNFHVFYQLFKWNEASRYSLRAPADFRYLKGSELRADGIDDGKWLNDLKHAMKTVGMSQEQTTDVFRILAGILHLGNIEFRSEGQDKAAIANPDVLHTASDILGIEEGILRQSLLYRGITSGSARGSAYNVPQNAEQALTSCDALAKGIYSRLFNWIVHTTNESMRPEIIAAGGGSSSSSSSSSGGGMTVGNSIGILDIYGFEIFEYNSFEQLCINYVNETLHQIFIDLTLRAEQDEYVKEGIKWDQVQYHNNKPTVDFLTGKPMGLFKIVDEECLFPNGTEATFLDKMSKNFANSQVFQVLTKGPRGTFSVRHYAGDVTYQVEGFLEKNRDTMFDDLKDACKASNVPTLVNIFHHAEAPSNVSGVNSTPRKFGGQGGKSRPTTGGHQFTTSVAALLKTLYACQPHYIRTIKPNDTKTPLQFNEDRVREQARYLGLTENLRVRRAGYAYRAPYERWMKRYGILSDATFPPTKWQGSAREGVVHIIGSVGISKNAYAEGNTKIFVRDPQALYKMEEARLRALDRIANNVKTARLQPMVVEGNLCLEYLRILIFEELPDFTVNRPVNPKDGTGGPITYDNYQALESDYAAGTIHPNDLKASLYQVLTDIAMPVREHVVMKKQKSSSGFLSGFFKFFSKGKQPTASMPAPN